ncbi:MAG: protein-L-isoaspartate(D-aspartate) O-methyltransferase [Gammaproteobacteria bacterium]|nr:protein-L-isoaspartate(D-aspartate) O-methyltransferase [Gammaproteobacteria bacterium]
MNAGHAGIGMTSMRTRDRLVNRLREEGIRSAAVLEAIRDVPRHLFVDEALASRAYEDTALPIGFGQTISQPYIVALMTEAVLASGTPQSVLEVGTGSGYQAAVLSRLVPKVYSVERHAQILQRARRIFRELRIYNIKTQLSDGSWGWPGFAPYEAIVVTAAPLEVPETLLEQLADGGRMVIPVGDRGAQELRLITRDGHRFEESHLAWVSFVPLVPGRG